MKVRAYIRRSHEREGGVSLEVQRDAITSEVLRRGWTLDPLEYVDDDRSAFRDDLDNRPAIRLALEHAEQRRFDVLMVYKWDRLARSEAIFHTLIAQLKQRKVKTISATESEDPLARSLSGLLAAEYSRILSRRMRDVRRWEASQGKLIGPVPFGYQRGPDGIAIPSADAETVLRLGELYATGEWSVLRLAQHFNLNRYAVEEMLNCRVYRGEITCVGEVFPGKHQAIWSPELWDRIQNVRAQRSRRRVRPAQTHDPLLAGLIYCASCGAPRWHSFSGDRRYYECSTRPTGRPGPIADLTCDAARSQADDVEAILLSLIASLASIPGFIEDIQSRIPKQGLSARTTSQAALSALKQRFLRDEISASAYERDRLALLNAPPPAPTAGPDPAVVHALLNDLPRLLSAATATEIRPVLRELVTEVYTRRREVIGIRPTMLGAALFETAAASPDQWLKSACWWAGWVCWQPIPATSADPDAIPAAACCIRGRVWVSSVAESPQISA